MQFWQNVFIAAYQDNRVACAENGQLASGELAATMLADDALSHFRERMKDFPEKWI